MRKVLALVFALVFCVSSGLAENKLDSTPRADIPKILSQHLTKIRSAYLRNQEREHARWTFNLLVILYKLPITTINQHHEILVAAVRRDGLDPYQSVAIDYGFRLLQDSSQESARIYTALKRAHQVSSGTSERSNDTVVFIREEKSFGEGYRAYSGTVGKAVEAGVFSALGEKLAKERKSTNE